MQRQIRRAGWVFAAGTTLALAGDHDAAAPAILEVPGAPMGVVAFDADRDGRVDLAVSVDGPAAEDGTTRVWLLRGAGGGAFDAPVALPDLASVSGIRELAAADVDDDGDTDLVGAGFPSVLWRNAAGAFTAETLPPEADGARVLVADVDDVRGPDLVVTSDATVPALRVLRNEGGGVFSALPPVEAAAAWPLHAMDAADVTGDSVTDVVALLRPSGRALLFRGTGNGALAAPVPIPVPDGSFALLREKDASSRPVLTAVGTRAALRLGGSHATCAAPCGDLGGESTASEDGALVALDDACRVVSLVRGDDGSLVRRQGRAVVRLGGGPSRQRFAAADFDGDGLSDVAAVTLRPRAGIAVVLGRRASAETEPAVPVVAAVRDDAAARREERRLRREAALAARRTERAAQREAARARVDAGFLAHLPLTDGVTDPAGRAPGVVHGGVSVKDGEARFDGTGWIELPHVPIARGPHAFAMWIRPDGDAAVMGLVEQRDADARRRHYHLMLRGNRQPYLGFYMDDLVAPAPVARGRWTHLVFQYTGERMQVWEDGQLVAERAGPAYEGTGGATRIGRNPGWCNVGGSHFTGAMRGVRIYGRALDAADVAAIRRRDAPPLPRAGTTLVFEGPVDGSERIVVTAGEARWENVHWGLSHGEFRLNGVPWVPRAGRVLANSGATRFLPPGVDLARARLVSWTGRDLVAVEASKDRLVLRISDSPNGPSAYTATIAFD